MDTTLRDLSTFQRLLDLRERRLDPESLARLVGYASEIFAAMGLDLTDPACADTPRRFIDGLVEATEGYAGDPKLIRVFDLDPEDAVKSEISQIFQGPIHFQSLCEHHALPFHGRAYIGYIAEGRIIGLSKLSRLVRTFARRFSIQERLTQQIGRSVEAAVNPRGVAVLLEAEHSCTQIRGVRETSPCTRTTNWRGAYADDSALRSEFLLSCGLTP